MNVNNNINQYNSSFSGIKKDKTSMTKDEKTMFLLEKGMGVLHDRAEREVPENGKFTRLFIAFKVPETQNEAIVAIEHDALNPKDSRRVSVGVHRECSPRLESKYIFKGTKKEVLDFVKNEETIDKLFSSVNDLSNSVDDYYSSL